MEMEEQYGIADLRQFMSGRPIFTTAIPPPQSPLPPTPPDLLSTHHHHHQVTQAHYEMVMGGSTGLMFRGDNNSSNTNTAGASGSLSGGGGLEMEMEIGGGGGFGGDGTGGGGNGRWPRQETLTLLEVRSRLDCMFKEANQKGPLWDEVSRYS